MKHLVSRELHHYWNRLRGARAAPERSDIDPAAIRTILADTFLAEVTSGRSIIEPDFMIRLSGTRLNALWAKDLTGRSLVSLWRDEDQAALREILSLVLDDQVPVVAGARAAGSKETPVELETLFLPLRHHGKTHARLFGSIVGHYGETWRGLKPLDALTLTSFRSLTPRASPCPQPLRLSPPRQYGRFTVYEGGR